jgi:alpha-glucosidase
MTQPSSTLPLSSPETDPDWWRGGIIYQIYPRSFCDTDGNGVGDLLGILSKLPYIASLGVDAIWISPFFKSPMADYGYDVSDYRDVDPLFGTLEDFDALIEAAHRHGLKVLIDLVLSHTSDQHPWFIESRTDQSNGRSDWYVWADAKPDGTPPNNWLSIFGGSAWQWEPRRQQYYLHNFLTSQPDLNFHSSEVQDALLDVVRFWLDRGVDGFRLDTINFYFNDKALRDNPALPEAKRNALIAPAVNPYNHQEHLYSKNQPENLAFLERFRAVLDEYDARTCVGEIGDAQRGLELLGEYTAGTARAHMCYAFEFLSGELLTASRLKSHFDHLDEVAEDGWACWALSNHDVMRHASRWSLGDAGLKCYATLLMCLRGSACLYQGEELGLHEADIAFEDLQDPYGKQFWPEYKGRDGCRTPMVWKAQDEFSGFSPSEPWLPIDPAQAERAVDAQEHEDASVLNHYRKVIALRQSNPALRSGQQTDLTVSGEVASFARTQNGKSVFCAFNLSDEPTTTSLPSGRWSNLGMTLGGADHGAQTTELEPWGFVILEHEG